MPEIQTQENINDLKRSLALSEGRARKLAVKVCKVTEENESLQEVIDDLYSRLDISEVKLLESMDETSKLKRHIEEAERILETESVSQQRYAVVLGQKNTLVQENEELKAELARLKDSIQTKN